MDSAGIFIIFGGITVPFLFFFINNAIETTGKKHYKKSSEAERSVGKDIPFSPVVQIKHVPSSEKANNIETLYRYIPDTERMKGRKWKCVSCETENSRLKEYCELCGADIRKGV